MPLPHTKVVIRVGGNAHVIGANVELYPLLTLDERRDRTAVALEEMVGFVRAGHADKTLGADENVPTPGHAIVTPTTPAIPAREG